MSEKMNFICLFLDADGLSTQQDMVDTLFALSTPWLHAPSEYTLLNGETGQQQDGLWSEFTLEDWKELDTDTLLFVYGSTLDSKISGNCIAIDKGKSNISYSISLYRRDIENVSINQVNEWLVHLHRTMSLSSNVLIAAGSEFELDERIDTITAQSFVDLAVSPFANCSWAIVPTNLLPADIEHFDVLQIQDDVALLYRKPYIKAT